VRIGLVGCVKEKGSGPTTAADLYTSALFRGRKRFVERTCNAWFILSAKHGLVDPTQVLEPYDATVKDQPRAARRAWSASVLRELQARLGPLQHHEFEIHAGQDYRNFGLEDGLRAAGATVEVPTAGLVQGRQLAFYRDAS
jgi:hypothetical protein